MNPSSENPAPIPASVTAVPVMFEMIDSEYCFKTTGSLNPFGHLSHAVSLLEGMKYIIGSKDAESFVPSDYLFISMLEMVMALINSVSITEQEEGGDHEGID